MEKSANINGAKPITHQALAKLPAALAPLAARSQWCVWRWVQQADGRWSKPPFQAYDPQKHASTKDPNTWTDYATALAAVQAGQADGISYVLTEEDPLAAADLDHCRDAGTGSIAEWAQNLLDQADNTYSEITPSGSGLRVWGTASGDSLHRKFSLDTGKDAALELFRHTHKALTVTGLALGSCRQLGNIDLLLDRACLWAERHKAAPAAASTIGSSFGGSGTGSGYSVDQIEQIVRTGAPDGTNRSNLFHTVVGHYVGCGWTAEQILAHLQQFPNGIGERYFREDRLAREIARSVSKYAAIKLPLFDTGGWTNNWQAKTAQPELKDPGPDEPDPRLQEDQELEPDVEQPREPTDEDDLTEQEPDPEELNDDELEPDQDLPPLYAHGDVDPRPLKSWLVKGLIPLCGHGLLSGQWGTYKSFVALELSAALMTGQPFLGCMIKRQCGALYFAAEGADEMRLRLNAVVREKCGRMLRAPFRWYEAVPVLLQPGAVDKLVALAKQAEASLQAEFGLPLGLIIIDTIAASAGYAQQGAESDSAIGQHVMNVLKAVAQKLSCFTLGIDHFGKNINTGTRGSSSKEGSVDLVLACLGDRELNGRVINTRLAVRKCRGGPQGHEFFFTARKVEDPEPDEDGDPITTLVIDWKTGPEPTHVQGPPDPWQSCRRSDQQTAVTRLKRILMAVLAERGVDLPITPGGPTVRTVDREIVREEFYAHTSADGTPKQKRDFRHAQFKRALDWAEQQQLIGVLEVNDVIYLWLNRPDPPEEA